VLNQLPQHSSSTPAGLARALVNKAIVFVLIKRLPRDRWHELDNTALTLLQEGLSVDSIAEQLLLNHGGSWQLRTAASILQALDNL
jgi:hypothetical protein